MSQLPYLLPILALIFMAGCSWSDRTTSPSAIPSVSRLQLNQEIQIEANTAHTNVQFGHPGEANLLEPFCTFLVSTVSAQPQLIRPAIFIIDSVTQRMEPGDTILGDEGERLRMVSLSLSEIRLADADYASIDYVTDIKLSSAQQPQVRRMVCHKEDEVSGRHLNVDEIKEILGPVAVIELAFD